MIVWVVGRCDGSKSGWHCMGVFSSEGRAIDACNLDDFIGPVTLDERAPDDPVDWPGGYVPHPAP